MKIYFWLILNEKEVSVKLAILKVLVAFYMNDSWALHASAYSHTLSKKNPLWFSKHFVIRQGLPSSFDYDSRQLQK